MNRWVRNRFEGSRYRPDGKGIRPPVVAGIYYPEEPAALKEAVDRLLGTAGRGIKKQRAVGIVAPHGGFRSAGAVLGAVHASVEWPAAVVAVGPNHSGRGSPFGLSVRGVWSTPLGPMPLHERLARLILKSTPDLQKDGLCHQDEHSLEVHLPFLQRAETVAGFVPIAVGPCDPEIAERIGQGIARAVQKIQEPVLLLASVNLTTYRPEEVVREKDRKLLEPLLELQAEKLLKTDAENQDGMCGASAAAAVLAASKILGARRGRLVRYQTSAEATGVRVSSVGYAGVVLEG